MMKKILTVLVLVMMIPVFSWAVRREPFTLSGELKLKIKNEAEDWIDDMPDGMQDKLSDAVAHAMRDSYQEINFFRNYPPEKDDIDDIEVKEQLLNGKIKGRLYFPKEFEDVSLPLLIYFHGGGWSMGSVSDADNFCKTLAKIGGIKIFSVDYPLAPESSSTKIMNYCLQAIDQIIKNGQSLGIDKENISLGGEGAGGNLALMSLLNQVGDPVQNIKEIKSIVLYYPLLSLEKSGQKGKRSPYSKGYGLDRRLLDNFIEAYVGTCVSEEKEALTKDSLSPLKAKDESLKRLPQILIITGGRDMIMDDEDLFVERLKSLNVKQDLIIFPDAVHGFITDRHQPTALQTAVKITAEFLNKK